MKDYDRDGETAGMTSAVQFQLMPAFYLWIGKTCGVHSNEFNTSFYIYEQ
uniref:Lipoprotein n=1 Tax=Heterorhabditis bacteriophora TaxID=37862 RepID=A0A1I7X6J7_HETBA